MGAHMTEDVAFYVDLARESDGPIVEYMIDGQWRFPSRWRPVAR